MKSRKSGLHYLCVNLFRVFVVVVFIFTLFPALVRPLCKLSFPFNLTYNYWAPVMHISTMLYLYLSPVTQSFIHKSWLNHIPCAKHCLRTNDITVNKTRQKSHPSQKFLFCVPPVTFLSPEPWVQYRTHLLKLHSPSRSSSWSAHSG